MTIKTLMHIENILSMEVQQRAIAKQNASDQIDEFEAAHDLTWQSRRYLNKVPEEIRYTYAELVEALSSCRDMYTEAANALADFENHDWH